jgi:hypothetical protein
MVELKKQALLLIIVANKLHELILVFNLQEEKEDFDII